MAATAILCEISLSGCSHSYGFTKTRVGNELRSEFCDGVREFVRAPLDEHGLRRAWFLPLGVYEDGSIDFYAPMSSKPSDAAASEFYNKRAGQLTHYTTAPQFAYEFSKCLLRGEGFVHVHRNLSDEVFSGSYLDDRHNRVIELRAKNRTTSIFIAHADWTGDISEAMAIDRTTEGEGE